MICNLVDLDDAVRREVLERFDHENLNLRPEFAADGADNGKSERSHLQHFEAKL